MANDIREVAIDADFFRKLTENDKDGTLFMKIMVELNRKPVMHEYVYSYELGDSSLVKKLKEQGDLKVYTHSDYVKDIEQYRTLFGTAYRYFNYKEFIGDVISYHHEKESLGEIRTSIMAYYMGIDLFMSDDGGAKKYVLNRLNSRRHRIDVYNIYDTLQVIGELQNRKLKWSEIKGMAKVAFAKKKEKYDSINEIWHPEDK